MGCRLNALESERMADHARSQGLSDLVIVNTCAVTGEAQRQARQAVRRAKRDHPEARVVATGCAVQVAPNEFARLPEADRVLGNAEKLRAESWTKGALRERMAVGDVMAETTITPAPVDGTLGRARAYLQVQNGCDHRCTFCIIPFGRGNARSLPIPDAVDQARRLVEAGHGEIVLTGVDLTSWGADLDGLRLGDLCAAILRGAPELPRLRLSSVDGVEIDPVLMRLFAEEPRLCPHVHLSLQSGANLILKRMKRRHQREDAIALCRDLRRERPEIAFGADLIAGFPTETDAHFHDTLSLIEECNLSFIHAFPFSPRPGTPAARMPQRPAAQIRARAEALRAKAAEALRARLQALEGAQRNVLVEAPGRGRTECFAEVALPADLPARPGAIAPMTLGPSPDGRRAGCASDVRAAA